MRSDDVVDVGVIAEQDARLIFATRFAGRPLREAARWLGLRYETGKKRRQRAEARWAACWTSDGTGVPDHSSVRPEREEVA